MKRIKGWTLEKGRAQNRARDLRLEHTMQGFARVEQHRWRNVRKAAEALLLFAYERLDKLNDRSRARISRQLRSVLDYGEGVGRCWSPARSGVRGITLSDEDLRSVQREIHRALIKLVMTLEDGTPPLSVWWEPPPARIEARYHPLDVDDISYTQTITPPYLSLVYAAAAVLCVAIPWLRFCELCGRLFFKVKRQRLCDSQRCRDVFHARRRGEKREGLRGRKGDENEKRGRPRTDYAAAIEKVHTEWIRMATEKRSRH